MIILIVFLGLISMFSDLALFSFYINLPKNSLRTIWFVLSVLTEIGLIFIVRNHRIFWTRPYPSLPLISASIFISLITIILPYTSIGHYLFSFVPPLPSELVFISILLIIYLVMSELIKLLYFKKMNKSS